MHFLDVDRNHTNNIQTLNNLMKDNKDVFVLIHMDGCGPCKQTLPEWKKLQDHKHSFHDNMVVANVEQDMSRQLNNEHLNNVFSFPTIRHIRNNKATEYNDNRSTDSFVNWIKNTMTQKVPSKNNQIIRKIKSLESLVKNKTRRRGKSFGNIKRIMAPQHFLIKYTNKNRKGKSKKSKSKSKKLYSLRKMTKGKKEERKITKKRRKRRNKRSKIK